MIRRGDPTRGRFDHHALVRSEGGRFEELGRGAMGVTYRPTDTVLGRPVALKVIDARVAGRPEARERFLREARAAARLQHPHVASVFYYGVRRGDGQCFYAMELVEGESLEAGDQYRSAERVFGWSFYRRPNSPQASQLPSHPPAVRPTQGSAQPSCIPV